MVRMFVALTALILLSAAGSAAPDRGAKGREELSALEAKLHGEWTGTGPCDGGLAFRADGAYVRTHQGPAGANSSGTWKVRWDALPPTLVLTCRESDDAEAVGKTTEVRLLELNDEVLAFTQPGGRDPSKPTRFSRAKK